MQQPTPADTLARAVNKLRQAANAATPGPWTVHEANGFLRVDQPGPPSKAWTVTGADLAEENRNTAEYIALMHPAVGLALADWLANEAAYQLHLDETGQDGAEDSTHALAVARAIFGEAAE